MNKQQRKAKKRYFRRLWAEKYAKAVELQYRLAGSFTCPVRIECSDSVHCTLSGADRYHNPKFFSPKCKRNIIVGFSRMKSI